MRGRYDWFLIGRPSKFGNVGSDRERDAEFARMVWLRIISLQTLPDLGRRGSNYRVSTRVVLRVSPENGNAQRPLFQLLRRSEDGLFNDVPQQCGISSAVLEGFS